MKQRVAYAGTAALTVIGTYAGIVWADRGYLTREAVVMIGVLIVAGFAFTAAIAYWSPPRERRRRREHKAEIVLIPKRKP